MQADGRPAASARVPPAAKADWIGGGKKAKPDGQDGQGVEKDLRRHEKQQEWITPARWLGDEGCGRYWGVEEVRFSRPGGTSSSAGIRRV
jgi:hypothetical protein